MHNLSQHLDNILAIDKASLAVIAVFCGIAAYVLKEYLANPTMIIFVFPVLFAFSVLAHYGFVVAQMYSPAKLDQWLMWTILASILGAITGTGLVASIVVLRDGADRSRR
jgi:hypothetical protein